jgi:hypothetical protein
VLTSFEADHANRAVSDETVFAFAASENRILLTLNRRHFLRLHPQEKTSHAGIAACMYDPNFHPQAHNIDIALSSLTALPVNSCG